jgi:putative transposase
VRPATPLICAFIDGQKHRFGVAPICRALSAHGIPITPRTYWARLSAAPSRRALWDLAVTEILAGICEPDADGPPSAGVPVRHGEDVGAPEPAGHPGG